MTAVEKYRATDKYRTTLKAYRLKTREVYNKRMRAANKRFRERAKEEAGRHYGSKCYCCGETEPLLLGLDHIEGNGNAHRKEIKHERLCVWAKRNGWPPIFRVACHSCNLGSHLNGGTCPHQKKEAQMTTFK